MKLFASALLASICLSPSAFAVAPLRGDITTFEVTITAAGGEIRTGTQTIAVTHIDEANDKAAYEVVMEFGGDRSKSLREYPISYSKTFESSLKDIEVFCAGRGAVEEVTVPAGTFKSCRVEQTNGSVWIAEIGADNVVKADLTDDMGNNILLVLRSFVRR